MSSALSEIHASHLPSSAMTPSKTKWWKPFCKPIPLFDPFVQSLNQASHSTYPAKLVTTRAPPTSNPALLAVFGARLEDSLLKASVAISMIGPDQKAYIYGFIPVVVAKCGLYLKEHGTNVEGIFRISGSTKRMKELQKIFDQPPYYGKDLDWNDPNPNGLSPQPLATNPALHTEVGVSKLVPVNNDHFNPLSSLTSNDSAASSNSSSSSKPYFSVHDASNVLRRYLMSLPEPLIPLSVYEDFRQVLNRHPDDKPKQIRLFKSLIATLNPPNQYLLLYLLDLLAVFANRSQFNLMTANNLAVVFQPALCPTEQDPGQTKKINQIINHHHQPASGPEALKNASGLSNVQQESLNQQDTIIREAKQAQEVLEFMILHQSCFVMGLRPRMKPDPSSFAGSLDDPSLDFEYLSDDEGRFMTKSTSRPSPSTTLTSISRRSNGLFRSPSSLSSSSMIDRDEYGELLREGGALLSSPQSLTAGGHRRSSTTASKMVFNPTDVIKRSKTLPPGSSHPPRHKAFGIQWNHQDVLNQSIGTPVEALDGKQRLSPSP